MIGTIGPDGYCTRCQLVAEWCECEPIEPVTVAPGVCDLAAGPDPDPPDPDPPDGPARRTPGDGEAAPFTRFDLCALLARGVSPPALLCGGLL